MASGTRTDARGLGEGAAPSATQSTAYSAPESGEPPTPALERLFNPRGIAVVGASADLGRIGGQPIKALTEARYAGRIYPVNPKYAEVGGMRCYRSIADIDGDCDLALIALSAGAVAAAVEACGAKGIRFAIILSSGFKEIGEGGRALETALKDAGRRSGVRLIGPNCQGVLSIPNRLFATFGAIAQETALRAGAVSMAFQSGGFGFGVMLLCEEMGIGFRHCVSVGNEVDITTPELLDAFLDDPHTKVACAYVEGVSDGRALMATGRKSIDVGKPVLVWKAGKSAVGRRAAGSHTANITGSSDVFRAAARQSGIIEVGCVEDMVDLFRVFTSCRPPHGNRVGVLGISGGSGIVFADAAADRGLVLPDFAPDTTATLRNVIPVFGSAANPADLTADVFNNIASFTEAMTIVLDDPGIDQLCLLLASLPGAHALNAAQAIVAAAQRSDKPILVGWSARRNRAAAAYEVLERAGIPIISTPERLARASAALAAFADTRRRLSRRAVSMPAAAALPMPNALLEKAQLSEAEGKQLLAMYGIPVTRDVLIEADDRMDLSGLDIVFPVAVKIVSADIPHKTDVGGVQLDIADRDALQAAVRAVLANVKRLMPEARIDGIMISEMIRDGRETLVGVVNDEAFGPTVVFGLGGIFVEVLRDVSYRVAPFDIETAREMVGELRSRILFDGYRGSPALDVDALCRTLVRISEMAWHLRTRLASLDINPLFVRPGGWGVVAADAVVTLGG
jgi:acetyltransferase